MSYWYAYTGESLVAGRGRMIQHVVTNNSALEDFIATAAESYNLYSKIIGGVSEKTYSAALIAALAMQEFGEKTLQQNFTSLRQVYNLFEGLDIEQVAVNFLNGRIVSGYKVENLAKRIIDGFASGELLFLPRDSIKLHSPEIINKLLGIIAFLLTKSAIERKAFSDYLRRGTPPILDSHAHTKIAGIRPVLASFSKEIRKEKMLWQKGYL